MPNLADDNRFQTTNSKDSKSRGLTKGQKTKAKILKKAIQLMGQMGSFEITFEQLAKASKVTRPLIHHYFPKQQDLFEEAVLIIRKNYQKHVVGRMEIAKTPKEKLIAYLESAMDWTDYYPEHMAVWLLYFAAARLRDHERQINTQLVDIGHDRIQNLINELNPNSKTDLFDRAKMIQTLLTGSIVSLATETRDPQFIQNIRQNTVNQCLKWAMSNS